MPAHVKKLMMVDKARRLCSLVVWMLLLIAWPGGLICAQQAPPADVPRMTGRYHFLGPEDTLAVLQEESMLKGYVDVYPGPNESDAILSYAISIGSRQGNKVEIKTRTIHAVYYRFSGTVGRGTGRKPTDPDYLRLTGELDTITLNSVTGAQKVQKQQVVFRWIPRGEGPPD